jgi:hypothetical protein
LLEGLEFYDEGEEVKDEVSARGELLKALNVKTLRGAAQEILRIKTILEEIENKT